MKRIMLLLSLASQLATYAQQYDFGNYPTYAGSDLGLTVVPAGFSLKLWAPTAEKVEIRLYKKGWGDSAVSRYAMTKKDDGVWVQELGRDKTGMFYTFRVFINGKWSDEVVDPYVKIVGLNGRRGMLADLAKTNPDGWTKDRSPQFRDLTDAIIYELQVRDASMAANSGIRDKGKFTGLTEQNTKNADGLSTGIDHIKEMGVTHVHLLPFFDFKSIDEAQTRAPYNWGYDPLNFNALEGSFSTNAEDGLVRIREFKKLVKTFHENGLRVVMDVVYNHTGNTANSNFNQLVPGYYYRQTADGKFSNATACGNETASERTMMRKFILESMKFWMDEYHIDGFRVDLMGVHDIATMNLISRELRKSRPDMLLYGEGWTAGASPLPDSTRALKKNAFMLDHIAVFCDDMRDGIKGSVFEHADRGFVSGKPAMEESIRFGIVAACKHPQVDYKKVNYSKAPYANQPYQVVSYTECHDNHVLWDKLALSAVDATEEDRIRMHKLALAIVLTSQGISFLHAGTEFLRTKKGVENSFESPDSINAIDWSMKTRHRDVVEYVKKLIALRKAHPAFRMMSAASIAENLRFMDDTGPGVVAYEIDGARVGDAFKKIIVVLNSNRQAAVIKLPKKNWKLALGSGNFAGNSFSAEALACTILYQ